MKTLILAIAAVIATFTASAQSLSRVEYFYDTDPGYGAATVVNSAAIGSNKYDFSISGLSQGAHMLYVRAKDSDDNWSAVISHPLYVLADKPQSVSAIEFFVDTDPGYGSATALSSPKLGSSKYVLDISSATAGAHLLNVRAKDEIGNWSPVVSKPIYVAESIKLARIEYFIDKDPGEGAATNVNFTASSYPQNVTFDIDTKNLSVGKHTLNVRAKGDNDKWSTIGIETFEVKGQDGVTSVSIDLWVTMRVSDSICYVDFSGSADVDALIEIYNVSGQLIASQRVNERHATVATNAAQGSVIFVKAIDLTNNKVRFVKALN